MKLIIKIAKNELRNLFYSPVAWFLAIAFLVMCAYYYTGLMYPWAKQFFVLLQNDPSWIYRPTQSVTALMFSSAPGGFFSQVLPNVYLFVPLLTMGIINREANSGTIKLLYSSPVKLRQIVLGKYLALMIYNLLLISITGIFILSGFFDIKSLDIGPLLSATLGLYLLLCSFTAIGFFMSSLSSYPIVSAIASFTVLFVLMRIGGLWQQYDFVRDLTWFLSIRSRTEKMVIGLITTKDIIYYLVIICMFIGFTILKLKGDREATPWYVKAGRYAVIVVFGLLIGYTSTRPQLVGYFDTTALKSNTLHPKTQEFFKKLGDSTLEVTLYTNLFDKGVLQGLPNARNAFLDMWEPYIRFNRDIKFRYEYYYDLMPDDSSYYNQFPGKTLKQIAGLIAKGFQVDSALFKSPEEMRKQIDLKPYEYKSVMQLRYGQRTTFTYFFPTSTGLLFDEGSTEPNYNAAFSRLKGTKMPKLAFITGELERSIFKRGEREYSQHSIALRDDITYKRVALTYLGFDIDTLNLSTQEIPADIATLVLADPKVPLSPVVESKLKDYIDKGGNMLVFGEPGKQYVLNPFLQRLGIQLREGQLVQPNANETPDKITNYFTPVTYNLADEYWFVYFKNLMTHKVRVDTLPIMIPGMASISYIKDSGFLMSPLTMTMPGKSWIKTGKLVTDSVPPVFDPQAGDIKENNFVTSIQLTRQRNNKEQRIIVCGDADMSSNLRNIGDFTRGMYSWLSYNQFPAYTPIPSAKDNIITLGPGRAGAEKIIYVWVLPGILLLMGTILLVRRKRK